MAVNLAMLHGPVVMVSITAPGEDRLPWDEYHCSHRRPHKHRGPAGCRVQERAAREWADTCSMRWGMLRRAAVSFTRRYAPAPPIILERVWEPQKRGVPHLHIVLPFATPAQQETARIYAEQLARLAPEYDFGFVDTRLKPITALDAARYLSSYLTGRNSRKKDSIRENIANPIMPRSLIWLTPALNSVSESARMIGMRAKLGVRLGSGVTMRTLRRARQLWAFEEGFCSIPRWQDLREAVIVAAVYRTIYPGRAGPLGDLEGALRFASELDTKMKRNPRDLMEYDPERSEYVYATKPHIELAEIALTLTAGAAA